MALCATLQVDCDWFRTSESINFSWMGFKKLLSLENDNLLKMLQVGLFFAVYLNKQIRSDKINLWKRNKYSL